VITTGSGSGLPDDTISTLVSGSISRRSFQYLFVPVTVIISPRTAFNATDPEPGYAAIAAVESWIYRIAPSSSPFSTNPLTVTFAPSPAFLASSIVIWAVLPRNTPLRMRIGINRFIIYINF